MQDALVHRPEARAERGERQQLLGVVAEQVRRRRVQEWLDRLADHLHVVRVLVVCVGVVLAVPGDLLQVLVVVLAQPQVVAVLHRGEGRRHQERHEPVLGQLELVDDVGPEEAQGVREGREPEARVELLGDRRAADERAALEDQGLEPRFRQVGAVDEAVVAAADDDGVVGPIAGPGGRRWLRCRLRSGLCDRLRRGLGRGLRLRHVRPSSGLGCRAASAPSSP